MSGPERGDRGPRRPTPDGRVLLRSRAVDRLANLLFALVVLVVAFYSYQYLAPVITPLLVSLLLAYVLDPLIDRFEARGVNRGLAISLVAAVVLGGLVLVLALAVPTLTAELTSALSGAPARVLELYARASAFVEVRFHVDLDQQLRQLLEQFAGKLEAALTTLLTSALESVGTVLNMVIIPIFTFYFLRDFDRLKVVPLEFIPPRYRDRVVERARSMDDIVGQWIRGQVQVAIMVGLLYGIGFQLVGIKLGFIIGFCAGMLNVVPYLGAAAAVASGALMILVYGSPIQFLGLAGAFTVVQMLEGYYLTPRFVGERVGMSPLLVMVVLLIGGSLFGFFGLLLSIPLAAAGSVLASDALGRYRSGSFFRGESEEDEPPTQASSTQASSTQASPAQASSTLAYGDQRATSEATDAAQNTAAAEAGEPASP